MYRKSICWGSELLYDQVLCCRADPLHCVSMTCNATTMHHSSWQACPLSSGKSGKHTVDLGDLGVEIPVVLCGFMLGRYRCSFIEAWSYWVVTFRSFFHSVWPLTRVWDHDPWSNHQGVLNNCSRRGEITKSKKKKKKGSSMVYFCQTPILQSPTVPYARASATDVMMLG